MKILALGDSFTYGEELVDRTRAWPCLIAEQLNGTVVNKGLPGGSNDAIIRLGLEHITSNKVDLVIIGWTSPGRIEFADDKGIYDIWPGYQGKKWVNEDLFWRRELIDYISRYHNIEYLYERHLNQILLMQSFLKSNDIKYIMLDVVNNEFYKRKEYNRLKNHEAHINTDQFIEFKKAGMLEWTFGCTQGPYGHFLEDGHRIVADKVYEHIRHLGWVS